jgi:hypothetical protein
MMKRTRNMRIFHGGLSIGGGVMDTTAAAVFGLLAAMELHPGGDTSSTSRTSDDDDDDDDALIQCGVYAPMGGFQAVTDALERLCWDVAAGRAARDDGDDIGGRSNSNNSVVFEIKCQHTVTRVTNRGVYYIDGSSSSSSSSSPSSSSATYFASSNNTDNSNDKSSVAAVNANAPKIQFEPADLIIVNADLPYAQATLLSTAGVSSTSLSSSSSWSPSTSSWSNKVENKKKKSDRRRNGNPQQQQSTFSDQSPRPEAAAASIAPATATTTASSSSSSSEPAAAAAIRYDWNDREYRFSSGVIAFHWSMNTTLDFLNTHNVYLSASTPERAQQSWQVLRRRRKDHNQRHQRNARSGQEKADGDDDDDDDDANTNEIHDFWRTTVSCRGEENKTSTEKETSPPFNFYVHRPSKTDPTAAPKVRGKRVPKPCFDFEMEGINK